MNRRIAAWGFAALVVMTFGERGIAGNGIIEINQVKALAGGVTPDDTPGFPVTISRAGSYRLTSNLDVRTSPSPASLSGIMATVSEVTIDLNGFWIIGPANCSWASVNSLYTVTCANAPIDALEATGVYCLDYCTVKNGGVRGMADNGIRLGGSSTVQNVTVASNASAGIVANGDNNQITDSVSTVNGFHGINAGAHGRVEGCTVSQNGNYAIMGSGAFLHNTVRLNQKGLNIFAGSVVLGNSVSSNSGYGLTATNTVGYGQNVFSSNYGANPEVSGGIQLGTNVCDTILCP